MVVSAENSLLVPGKLLSKDGGVHFVPVKLLSKDGGSPKVKDPLMNGTTPCLQPEVS